MSWKSLSKFRTELMGLACLWVMLHHTAFDWPLVLEPLERFSKYGNLGVDIFLLLSGVGLYYAWSGQPKLSDFYVRRFVRLLVPYLLFALPYWVWWDLYLHQGSFLLDLTHVLIRNVFYHYIPIRQFDPWGVGTYAIILLLSLTLSALTHPVITKLCGALTARKESV